MRFTSLLFIPGDSEKKCAKVEQATADIVIFDLEDAVAMGRKAAARDITKAAIALPSQAKKFVRVNALDTGMTMDDIKAVIAAQPDGIVLPKVNCLSDIALLSDMIALCENADQKGQTKIIAIVTETVQGVMNLMRETYIHPRLIGMMWGAEDLSADIGASRNKEPDAQGNAQYTEPFRMARNLCLLAARAAGVTPIDAVYPDFRDMQGLATEASQGRKDGFDAKAAIHPAQIEVIQQAYQPSEEEISWAKAVMSALDDETGVASLNGMMLDAPHIRNAQKILGI